MTAPAKTDPKKTKLAKEHKHNRPLTACHWDPTSRFIFFGAEDNLVHRYEVANGKVTAMSAHDSWVRSFASSTDGKVLFSGGYDGRLIAWSATAETPQVIRKTQAHDGWARAVAVSPRGKTFATCGNDRLVKLWDVASGKLLKTFEGHDSHVYNVAFTSDGNALVSCDLKADVRHWPLNNANSRKLTTVKALHGYDTTFRADIGGARSIATHSDGKQVAFGGITNVSNAFAGVGEVVIALVNLQSGKIDRIMRSKDKARGAMWGLAYHRDGYWLSVSGGGGGSIWFWKGDTENEFHQVKLKTDGRGMSLSPDQTHLAVANSDGQLRTYKLTP